MLYTGLAGAAIVLAYILVFAAIVAYYVTIVALTIEEKIPTWVGIVWFALSFIVPLVITGAVVGVRV